MTGQDAVNSAKAFNDALDLNGVILTKLDGDARGGAALSIKEVTQVPIKFIGVGEKLDRLEEFRPEGMAQRILGQGDLMGVIEKVAEVQQQISAGGDRRSSRRSWRRATSPSTTSASSSSRCQEDGRHEGHASAAMPGMSDMIPEGEDPEDGAVKRIQGMIDSMTKEERRNPDVIDLSRRRRIAARQRHRAARDQAVPQPVRPGADADAADGQDEHVGADQDGDRHGQGGRVPARSDSCPRRRAAPATARAPRNGPRNARRKQEERSGR